MISGEVVSREMAEILNKIAASKNVKANDIWAYFVIINEKNNFNITVSAMKLMIVSPTNQFQPYYTNVRDWLDMHIAIIVRKQVKAIMGTYAQFANKFMNTKIKTEDVIISVQQCNEELVKLHALYKEKGSEQMKLIEKMDLKEIFG